MRLVSHALCPYVQRVAIVLQEKGVPFERATIDLADKPRWFEALSPLGKVPLLELEGQVLFESAAILEFLDDTIAPALHPRDAVQRARHRAWMEFGSVVLNTIAGFYNAPDEAALEAKRADLQAKFERLEQELDEGPWFGGGRFSMVDAVFGPVMRYFDAFDRIDDFGFFANTPKLRAWRGALAGRPSMIAAVSGDYPELLRAFIAGRRSALSAALGARRATSSRRPSSRAQPPSRSARWFS